MCSGDSQLGGITNAACREDLTSRYNEMQERLRNGCATQADFQALVDEANACLVDEMERSAHDRDSLATSKSDIAQSATSAASNHVG